MADAELIMSVSKLFWFGVLGLQQRSNRLSEWVSIPGRPRESREDQRLDLQEAFCYSVLCKNPKPLINMALLILDTYLSRGIWDVVLVAIIDGKINISIGEHKCQRVSGR